MNTPTIDIDPPRTIGQVSAETALLIKLLETAKIGQIVTYKQMFDCCKVDVQEHRSHLVTARRNLLKQSVVFSAVAGVGVKRLDDTEMPDEARDKQDRARRMAKKGLQILNCADMAKLDPEMKVRAITTRTVLGFITGAGSRRTVNLAEQSVRASNGELKVGKIEDLFKR